MSVRLLARVDRRGCQLMMIGDSNNTVVTIMVRLLLECTTNTGTVQVSFDLSTISLSF